MRSSPLFPFRRLTKPQSGDPAGKLKAGFFLLITGFTSHILFFEFLVLILKLDISYTVGLVGLGVTGVPEIDILTPLIIISLSPLLLGFTNPILLFIGVIPWIFAGFLTGTFFGPQYDRSILFAPPIFTGSIIILFLFFLFSLAGLGSVMPSIGILLISAIILLLVVVLGQTILVISMIMAIPAIVGYYFGKKYTFNPVPPQVLLAQPDRQDPDQSRCPFLDAHNYCAISNKKGIFFPNICDNKWNQVTCPYYLRKIKSDKIPIRHQQGDLIDEIQ
ncbi:MAG: hypothetical protein JSW11_09920 [Candidatus Heimdallarchaeota archaeon]|nr:MAG: hypothetical protein JSW11_09920 [Candidatus Heimdallarchaeota archaeon]